MTGFFSQMSDLYKMQKEARQMQKKMKEIEVSGYSKNEKVEIVMNGVQEVSVGIDESMLSPEHKAELEKSIEQAFADCQSKIQKRMMENMDMSQIKQMLGS